MPLYHATLKLPSVRYPSGVKPLVWTRHSIKAAETDRYGKIKRLSYINLGAARIVEVETSDCDSFVVKIVYRIKHCDKMDLVLVVIPDREVLVVKTVWLNMNDDRHETLNKTRYTY